MATLFSRLFARKSAEPPSVVVVRDDSEAFDRAARLASMELAEEKKSFDWVYYQQTFNGNGNALFTSEFNILPAIRVLKGAHAQELWVNACTNAISRQFLGAKWQLVFNTGGEKKQVIKQHPMLAYLRSAGGEVENGSYFTSNCIADLVLTGNAYWWTAKDLSTRRRLPSERVDPVIRANRIVSYRVVDRDGIPDVPTAELAPEEVVHLRMPNPFTAHVGMSLYIAAILPILIDKYGREYITGFFLRGGQTSGIIQTNTIDMEKLMRLTRSIMQAFGGRRNMHADKILPQGAEWKGQGQTFDQIKIVDMFKENVSLMRAVTGCTSTVLGQSDNVNRATAFAEMEFFWNATILPLQLLFCAGVQGSSLWSRFGLDERYELVFDNSSNQYLDDFDRRLDQDAKLAATWTLNERRERLGMKPIPRFADMLQAEIVGPSPIAAPPVKSLPAPALPATAAWKAAELEIQNETQPTVDLFNAEFKAWQDIVLAHLRSKDNASEAVLERGPKFAKAFSEVVTPNAMRAWDSQAAAVLNSGKTFPGGRVKESAQDRAAKIEMLRQRAKDIISRGILSGQNDAFKGYSQTAMDNIYAFIEQGLADGQSLDEIASGVRTYFAQHYNVSEAYPNQAQTIVRTEVLSAVSIGQAQFGSDLATATKRMSKEWVGMGDDHMRTSHRDINGQVIEDDSNAVIDATFGNGLRYPRDPNGDASEVINCRCTIRFQVTDWGS